jgi:hypothetical protein
MKTTCATSKMSLNREVVISFSQRNAKKHPGNPNREAIFTCCDGRSFATTPFRKA